MKCDICRKEILLNEQIYRFELGKLEKDEDTNAIGFERASLIMSYAHFTCYQELKGKKR